MSGNPLNKKVALPYARALFDFSVERNIMHQITADFQNLDIFFTESKELVTYLNNPIINQNAKREVLAKTLKSQINMKLLNF
jgi:F0F1-type ATP synthase delta subunit